MSGFIIGDAAPECWLYEVRGAHRDIYNRGNGNKLAPVLCHLLLSRCDAKNLLVA